MIKRKIFILTAMLLIGSWTYTFAQNEHNVLPAEASDANNMILNDTVAHQVSEQILFRIGDSTVAVRSNKLLALNGGQTYRFINEVFCPELLYGISPASQDNWKQLSLVIGNSDLANKSEILEIIRTKSPGLDREKAIRDLDAGETLGRIEQMAFTELLTKTDIVKTNGSGMSYSYELSPEAKQRTKERATAVVQRQAAEHQPKQHIQDPITTSITTPAQAKSWRPFIALKTDLMLWGGVMPGFEMGTWTPNLSAEIYFARRWSAQAGYAYSNWNKFAGTKELYAVSAADMEVRHWFGKQSQFNGFYLGVYGQYGQYDIQKGIQGQTGSFWSAGLGAGWMQPLSRYWALEAEIRGGYRSAQNNIYDIEEGHNYFNKKQTIGRFTPQFRLQVVYRIGKTEK